jgi:hypothetical protein
MNKRIIVWLIGVAVFLLAVSVNAQGITPNPNTPPNPNANISFPPPVYFLRGEMQIYGSANLPNMANYFLEYRPLIVPPSPDIVLPEIPWGPISLPSNVPVQDGLLGIWNTFTVADGLYEIRLTVNVPGQQPVIVIVSPLRVENKPSDFALRNIQLFAMPGGLDGIATPASPLVPVTTPETTTTGPTVTSTVDANVRAGDDTVYSVVGVLRTGTQATILGISSRGTGWYYIELPNGTRGFIAPSVVTVSGNTSGLPQINPPPRPAATAAPTIAPTRSVTNTPPSTGSLPDLGGALPSLSPNPPSCGVPFNILINIANIGSAPVTSPFLVGFEVSGPGGYFQSSTASANVSSGSPINPGGNFVVGSPSSFTISSGGGQQFTVRVYIDANYAITESNEGNNIITTTFTLSGGC